MELRMYFAIVRRWLWLIILCTILAGLGAYFVSRQQVPVYVAHSTVLLDNSTAATDSNAYANLLASQRLASTYAELFSNREAVETVISQLGYRPDVLKVQVSSDSETTLLNVSVESNAPQVAAYVANTLVEVVTEQQHQRQADRYNLTKSSLEAELADLEREIARLESESANDVANPVEAESSAVLNMQYETLLRNLAAIRLAEAQELDVLSLVERAEVPTHPIRPRIWLNTLLAAIVGAMIGLAAAFLIEYLDDTVKANTNLDQVLGLGPLALIGRMGSDSKGKRDRFLITEMDRSPNAEAYRMLRTNIRFASVDKELHVAVITSPGPGEGKSTTAANLAIVMAQAGKKTVLIDADLRRPVQHKIFKTSNRAGLTTALIERDDEVEQYLIDTEIEGLRLLPAGPIPPNPSELLGSHRMQKVLDELMQVADFVLVDSAPVLAVSDTSLLAGAVDGVLLVLRANITSIEGAKRAIGQLESVQAHLLGTVLNDVQASKDGYYYYYYNNYYAQPDRNDRNDSDDGNGPSESDSRPRQRGGKVRGAASLGERVRTLLMSVVPRR